jgi:uncharacterized protein YdiU (UPF0061 family)
LNLDELPFENRFTSELPADPEPDNRRRQVHGAGFSRVQPTRVSAPRTLAYSPEVAELLGIPEEVCRSVEFAQVFAGNRIPRGADPHAAVYGGHQFGSWAGQLGDGRAIALGEVRDARGGRQMLQLKGAGPTPYSRSADGRAVLRSSVREFLCSEAMHHLGIPTTRALSLVVTGEPVVRDMLYDGHPRAEPGAVVCRVAPSFVRFGNFELPASRGDLSLLRKLVEFTLRNDFPHLLEVDGFDAQVAALFREVCERTALLVAHWMRVGFVHGVLNTDNMSILGLTIDYGPYGWLESFDPGWTPNTTDADMRRYRYGAQPSVAQWNLLQLGQALVELTGAPEPLQDSLTRYREVYEERFGEMMTERLGWGPERAGDDQRVEALFRTLQLTETDQVLFFRQLARVPVDADGKRDDDALLRPLADAFYRPDELTGEVRRGVVEWLRAWGRRVVEGRVPEAERVRRMDALNPRYVLRNYLAQEAIDAAEGGDGALLLELLDVLRRPYDDQPGKERFCARRPEWARHRVGCSMLSCSS